MFERCNSIMIVYDCRRIDKDKKTKSPRNYVWEEGETRAYIGPNMCKDFPDGTTRAFTGQTPVATICLFGGRSLKKYKAHSKTLSYLRHTGIIYASNTPRCSRGCHNRKCSRRLYYSSASRMQILDTSRTGRAGSSLLYLYRPGWPSLDSGVKSMKIGTKSAVIIRRTNTILR